MVKQKNEGLAFFLYVPKIYVMNDNKKRRPGRPKMEAGQARASRLELRIRADELQSWKDAADRQGLTVSAWLRRIANAAG